MAWRVGCGVDGERPDAEPAAGDGHGGAGVEFGGDGREVGDQQGCLLVGGQVVSRAQQDDCLTRLAARLAAAAALARPAAVLAEDLVATAGQVCERAEV